MGSENKCITFYSSNAAMCEGFHWAKNQAFSYVVDDAPVGPCYESALPGRDAFCMRDVSHQSIGAHFLGLHAHNRNMMHVFAENIREERAFCSYWEINTQGKPAPVDYTNDQDFWYNLPANFDVTCACERLYDLTGDQGYLIDPVMANFHRISVENYLHKWDRDKDGIVDRVDSDGRRGIASYDECSTTGYSVAADAMVAECAALAATARMYRLNGESELAAPLQEKADLLKKDFNENWWSDEDTHFRAFRMRDGSYRDGFGINAHFPLHVNIISDPEKLAGHLDYIIENESLLNVEDRSYLPAILWIYGRDDAAMNIWLRMTSKSYKRREYPEVSFAAIDSLVRGYMGLRANASTNTIHTRSAVDGSDWAEILDTPLWGGYIDLKHEGRHASTLTNRTGRALTWNATFDGKIVSAQVFPGETIRLEK